MPKRVRSPEYLKWQREHKTQKYRERRTKGIEYLGGKCKWCASTSDLHFDHVNPLTKKFPISRANSEKLFWKAIEDCQLLCSRCHREKSNLEICGENCHTAKLTHEDVKSILNRLKINIPQIEIAKEFGIGAMQVSRIKKGTQWRYMTDES